MKKYLQTSAIFLALYIILYSNLCSAFDAPFICPKPKQVTALDGEFVFKRNINIVSDSNVMALLLKNEIAKYISISFNEKAVNGEIIKLAIDEKLNQQGGYKLLIGKDIIEIYGCDKEGLRNGIISLLWLIRDATKFANSDNSIKLKSMIICDNPDVMLRGMDLQLCYSGADMKFMYDSAYCMAMLKYNAIIPDLGLFYIPENVEISKEALSHLPKNFTLINRAEFREWVKYCQQWGLQVIPKVNCLGHSERGVPWVSAFGRGLDIGDEKNYEVLYAIINAYLEDCPSTKYIYIGMDEAVDCLRENSKKYNKPAYQLLAEHINKVVAYCKKRNLIPVIYHDMLLGSQEKMYWREGVANGTDLETYQARALISKDVIIDYWNYEGFERYRTVENIQKEGFKVWFTPWAGSCVRTMGQNAAILNTSIMGSTWIDCTYDDSLKLGGKYRFFYTCKWLQDAVANLAEITWNSSYLVKNSFDMGYDAGLVTTELYWNRPSYNRVKSQSIGLPEIKSRQTLANVNDIYKALKLKSGKKNFKGVEFELNADKAIVLGNVAAIDFSKIMKQPKPWSIMIDGKKCGKISGINKLRGANECVLYTRDFGRSTLANQYGTEAVVRCGQTHYCDTWGVGNNAIPRNGFVLSGQGGYNLYPNGGESYDNEAFSGYHTVSIVDADNDEVALGQRISAGQRDASISIDGKAGSLMFLHTTAYEAAHFMENIASIEVVYKDGEKAICDLRYGRDVCSYDDICFLYEKNDLPQRWIACADYGKSLNDGKLLYVYEWKNLSPEKELDHINISVSDLGSQIGYIILAAVKAE
ncbi:MAG: hypothetical protein A2Y12_10660 [Planctomycetes bacterium GWF2_42_9]|nr:MAG: hypothetical protein A2Y12_10660 [Planctomycetes bacterium GWF2_42_9]